MNLLAQVLFKNAFALHLREMFDQATEDFPKPVKISLVMILVMIMAAAFILAVGLSMTDAPDITIG